MVLFLNDKSHYKANMFHNPVQQVAARTFNLEEEEVNYVQEVMKMQRWVRPVRQEHLLSCGRQCREDDRAVWWRMYHWSFFLILTVILRTHS